MTAPTVFISYSQDSDEHNAHVLELANRLRADGIDATIDQYESSPAEGWLKWMDRHIAKDDFVLVICTETYYRRAMGDEEKGKGRGIKWESSLTYQHLYDDDTLNTRFIPILLTDSKTEHIPTPLKGATYYFLPKGYDKLYRRLTNQPETIKPELGKLKSLPPREHKFDYLGAKASITELSSTSEYTEFIPEHDKDAIEPVERIRKLIHLGSFNQAYKICSESLLNAPNHPTLNLLSVIALLKGKGADRLQENILPRVEEHLQTACNSPKSKSTGLVILGIIKYDHYVVNGLNEGTPAIDEIKHQLHKDDLVHIDMGLINLIKASDGALIFLGLR